MIAHEQRVDIDLSMDQLSMKMPPSLPLEGLSNTMRRKVTMTEAGRVVLIVFLRFPHGFLT
jgi:hypothetical protein